MAQFQTIKSVFNGGEMSPIMDGRTDSEKYATGCRVLENFIVRPYGGAFKRPGTKFGLSDSDVTNCFRLIAFRRSSNVNFVLGFKTNAIKVWSYDTGTFTLIATLTTDYTEAEIRAIHHIQLNDVMYLTVATKHPKIITRANDGTWSFTDVPFQFAPALDPPSDAVTMMLEYDANDWVTATSYSVGNFVLYLNDLYRCKTANSDVSFTAAKWDKATYQKPWNVDTAYVAGDVTEYFGSNYFCITANTATSANRPGTGAQWVLITITDYRLISSSAVFDANEVESTWLLSPGSSGRIATEPIATAPATTTTAAIFIQGSYVARTSWAIGFAPSGTVIQLQESLDRINFTNIREWSVGGSLDGTISYTAEAPNTGGWYRMVAIRTGTNANDARMTIEPVSGKLDIPFQIQSYVSTTQVRGIPKLAVDSLIPNEVIGFTFPVWRKGAFSVTRGYPRTCAFHDNRLFFASTDLYPTRIWGSQISDFYTFLTGSLDTSALDLTLAATQANRIQWISSFKRTLVIGTTGEEWTMDSGDQDSALTPSNARLRRWSRYGSSPLQPVLSGDGLLWLTGDDKLREFAYVFEKDGYSAPNMSLLAEHIPTSSGTITDMVYSQCPDPTLWFVHAGGELSGFTYDRENNVTAWHRHNFGSGSREIEGLCVVGTSDTDTKDSLVFLMESYSSSTYFYSLESIVGSELTTSYKSYSGTFSDSWRILIGTYNAGLNQTTFNVGTHLNDEKVVFTTLINSQTILNSDGSPFEVTVSSGNAVVSGNISSGSYVVGVPYSAFIMPNRFEVNTQSGTAQMNKWRISRVSFRLFQSKYGNVFFRPTEGTNFLEADFSNFTAIEYDDMDEFPLSSVVLRNTSSTRIVKTGQTKAQSIVGDWGDAVDITVASRHPWPFNVTAMLCEVATDGISGAGT
jgi:hypothetical protein